MLECRQDEKLRVYDASTELVGNGTKEEYEQWLSVAAMAAGMTRLLIQLCSRTYADIAAKPEGGY
jgi:hypothetical protein